MKNILAFLILVVVVSSCSTYQETLKSDDIGAKYALADSLYDIGKYKKSLKLWEQIVPVYRGRPQAERVMYKYSDTYYQLGDYYLAGYNFERFVKSYPKSTKREDAAFKSAQSYYKLSPRYNLDQGDTQRAMDKLQEFINSYPESVQIPVANDMVAELGTKIEKKEFEIAKMYNKIAVSQFTYPAAIKSMDNFLSDFPGSEFKEDALFYRLDSAYKFAIGSRRDLVTERLEAAKQYHETLIKYFPSGKYNEEATEMITDINERLAEAIN
ncbi:outer membrane protein assembly factor BamD [Dokdonia sinensis]|uniref:Outer membrane protein assembly factor BamD n=1 Tax=Dokdonia sinensis TaxID=2479847 RepID=A0A3M0FUE7_9FLAO|nr:outer membrane protein assembly factor BamD [Dokdonia sinensis]RMB56138.1 outer membrane protein assembly factor BamD [Dokdonia sinensis]